jgi:hypothetical protein
MFSFWGNVTLLETVSSSDFALKVETALPSKLALKTETASSSDFALMMGSNFY